MFILHILPRTALMELEDMASVAEESLGPGELSMSYQVSCQ